ncbi:beta-N-acetylhexosaminidase [Dongshaea marina]|uniref:beta-N-acetylhexosaminidase n=1 Tax=Dongshaea marina TaxID=2047966 RepID=UPI000D3E626A|nr:beta-N-acetylhexosaminidase [Dongshaea marina]
MGPVMVSVEGLTLQAKERDLIAHPLVGGVILFSRNYDNRTQLTELVQSIRESSSKELLIAVDHEGGRVQRFQKGLTRIPAMGSLTQGVSLNEALERAYLCGWVMAAELLALDIDLSFAPVLDLDRGSPAIGNRSFSADPDEVEALAVSFIDGMHDAGMRSTGKHFPGHGSVETDSHLVSPCDPRSFAELQQNDLRPFHSLIQGGKLDAIMPAHIIYPDIDADHPTGFSRIWLKQVLRQQLGFKGVIFSDDLSMEGAAVAGSYLQRAEAALNAGCDMVLACNTFAGAIEIVEGLREVKTSQASRLISKHRRSWQQLEQDVNWRNMSSRLQALYPQSP